MAVVRATLSDDLQAISIEAIAGVPRGALEESAGARMTPRIGVVVGRAGMPAAAAGAVGVRGPTWGRNSGEEANGDRAE